MIQMLFKLDDAEYEPLTSFSLLWRWTSPRYTELPTDVLECIRPIAQRKAALINDSAIQRVHSERPALGLKAESVRDVRMIDAADEDQSVVREWLLSLPIPVDETVIVSWDEDTAVTAPFAVVADYWSDFFYGSSDDAAIVPPDVAWLLVWDHEGTFHFGIASPQPGEAG
jgi:hypothetical protein